MLSLLGAHVPQDAGFRPINRMLLLFLSFGIFKDFRENSIEANKKCQSVESK